MNLLYLVTYNNQYAGCFDGKGEVSLANNKKIKVKHLKKGDKVLSLFNKVTEVICIVRIKSIILLILWIFMG